MADIASLVVPAAAALTGVTLSQIWTGLQARARSREQERQRGLEERRSTVLQYLIAMNRAVDSTRDRIRETNKERADGERREPSADPNDLDRDNDHRWAAAFEAFLAVELVLPLPARDRAKRHIEDTFAWRQRCLRNADAEPAPAHQELIEQLAPWLGRPN